MASNTNRKKEFMSSILEQIDYIFSLADIPKKDLIGQNRKSEIVKVRQLLMYVLRNDLKLSLPYIANVFNKDHTTVIHSIRVFEGVISIKGSDELEKYLDITNEWREKYKTLPQDRKISYYEVLSIVEKEIANIENKKETNITSIGLLVANSNLELLNKIKYKIEKARYASNRKMDGKITQIGGVTNNIKPSIYNVSNTSC